jgi:hypothetical protein
MQSLSEEMQKELDEHLEAVARILYQHTEPEKLTSFERIEWEVRGQILDQVAPKIGEFFYPQEERSAQGSNGL